MYSTQLSAASSSSSSSPSSSSFSSSDRKCAVCGDVPAKVHYGVLACFGCKGFFRRAVKDGRNKYICRFEKNCQVTKYERNSCRYCRFRRCLQVGMNPDYVRPDREEANKKQQRALTKKKSLSRQSSNRLSDDWITMLSPPQRNILSTLSNIEAHLQQLEQINFDAIAFFSLKSLLADRSLVRKIKVSGFSSTGLSSETSNILSIERIICTIDFVDSVLERLLCDRRVSIEDKCALISETFLALSITDSMLKLTAQGSHKAAEEFAKTCSNVKLTFSFIVSFNKICELLRRCSLSPMEYSIVRVYVICIADQTMISNSLGNDLVDLSDSLHELLFRIIKFGRRTNSVVAASSLANIVSFVHQIKIIAKQLHQQLIATHPPGCNKDSTKSKIPFQHIVEDILHPEVSDLIAQMAEDKHIGYHHTTTDYTPSTVIVTMTTATMPEPERNLYYPTESSPLIMQRLPPPSEYQFTAPLPLRPTALAFSSKLPLTITKSIEEMLRAPGVSDDCSILNRPLSKDWADGVRLTPVFSKDVVAQFFPELSETLP